MKIRYATPYSVYSLLKVAFSCLKQPSLVEQIVAMISSSRDPNATNRLLLFVFFGIGTYITVEMDVNAPAMEI